MTAEHIAGMAYKYMGNIYYPKSVEVMELDGCQHVVYTLDNNQTFGGTLNMFPADLGRSPEHDKTPNPQDTQ